MYESFLKLKGRKVANADTKKNFGRLSDILVNKSTNEIIGIISKNDTLLYRHRLFYMTDIVKIEEVTVFVKGYGEKFAKVIPIYGDYTSCENDIYKKRAVFQSGTEAGKIQNINFDFEAGMISEFEIGSSLMQDILNGRMVCPAKNCLTFVKGDILV